MKVVNEKPSPQRTWRWPLALDAYDRTSNLSADEQQEIDAIIERIDAIGKHAWSYHARAVLHRLLQPLYDALDMTSNKGRTRSQAVTVILRGMKHYRTSFWAWTTDEWIELLCPESTIFRQRYEDTTGSRHCVAIISYLLGGLTDVRTLHTQEQRELAYKVFGPESVDAAVQQVKQALLSWGYGRSRPNAAIQMVYHALLINQSPYLEDLSIHMVMKLRQGCTAPSQKVGLSCLVRVLVARGIITPPLPFPLFEAGSRRKDQELLAGVSADWQQWAQRWFDTSTLSPKTRRGTYYQVLKVGRWLTHQHPEVTTPGQWTRTLAIEYVAAVDRMNVGEYTEVEEAVLGNKKGSPLSARAKAHHLNAIRTFFRDGQEWGWFARTFDAQRCLAIPRSVRALIAPDPRVISDDSWAKLLWAGINLTREDLPVTFQHFAVERNQSGVFYPLEMVRALVLVWLFAGLRSDEIFRLRVGCIRWQKEDISVPGSEEVLRKDAICWLDVPIHKTGTAFTKAVDQLVGEAVEAWECLRPSQPEANDGKTGEMVHYLFSYRGRRMGKAYLNQSVIPMLCRKAGISQEDARGKIVSHRARSTIASQLYNAKEPLSLFELQAWLGHHSPSSTQHYAKKSPTKVAKAYEKAGYFGRNIRTVEVLIDQDVIKSGAAATGASWCFYDLGHGYCQYDFFDQCPHRMACAKCSFYQPKGSSQAQLLEGKANLLHMLQEIPLSEEERAAVEDGVSAMEKLCLQLAAIPTPAGLTPRELEARPPQMAVLPLNSIKRKNQKQPKES